MFKLIQSLNPVCPVYLGGLKLGAASVFLPCFFLLFMMMGCYDDGLRESYPGETLYYSFDNEKIGFTNDLGIPSFTTDIPQIETDTGTIDLVFLLQHRDDIYYHEEFVTSFKEYDYRLFFEVVASPNNVAFGYTNSDFTNSNINIYYYKILTNLINNNNINQGHLYFTNTGSDIWKVDGAFSNNGFALSFNQTFQKAALVNGSFNLE